MEGRLYSSYFRHLNQVPKSMMVFSVVRQPKDIPNIECLAPSTNLLYLYKSNKINYNDFIDSYLTELTCNNNANTTIINLVNLIKSGTDIVLVCYEKDNTYCHRKVLCELIEKFGVIYKGEI